MSENEKPGGGNKMQPYISAGNGEHSGEYTNKENKEPDDKERKIVVRKLPLPLNANKRYNYYGSKLVKTVKNCLLLRKVNLFRVDMNQTLWLKKSFKVI